ncbi:hypothetical protein COU13_01475 [Candidatus Kaiserbacteria bacterium CG10_big_fil_rev_8_21_14_0_10_43_70]|uniref:Magnesium transport protein CorA n=1 Tax=Candidatus Kaiserbacteria bacterium CG10_big_fil_rev_8_21_14_0_10_43_70 TaxID=1974605 RepID=A0A2H0UIY4_9BACT|nr:MAG: hypothetical protein COU13_01475 [Candidatus Kaiserbacteria bacterium CG10_big_fil_rev_8_21_14_0_10_43_70]
MLQRYTHNDLTWIDLESPTHEEVRKIMEEFGIDSLVAEELLLPTFKPRVELREQFIYIILHFPALRHTHKSIEQEIDFVIGRNFIITTRYDTIDPIHKFSKVFEVNSVLDKSNIGDHAGFVFYYMLKKMYKSVEHEIGYIQGALEDIESKIFAGKEKDMVEALSRSGRDLLNLRQAIEPHRDILKTIQTDSLPFFGENFEPYLRSLTNEYYRVHNHIMRNTEAMRELRETNNSLLSTKQNEVIKTLTLMAFVTFPLSLIAGIFGMNTDYLPIVGHPNDFWIIIGTMATGMLFMFIFFKRKGWL